MLALKVELSDHFVKTETGRQEIRTPVHGLSRSARNLLLIIDGSRSATEWVTMIQGATAEDLQDLALAFLIEPVREIPAPRILAAPEPDTGPDTQPFERAQGTAAPPSTLVYQDLYAGLNALAREQLGLIKGYRFSLDIERASGLAELEAVAQRFVQEVQKANGDAAARQVRRLLKLPP